MKIHGRAYLSEERGVTSAEFALVVGVFLALIFGTIGLSFALWANSTLQYAAQVTARCLSVSPSQCSGSNLQTYAMAHYLGPNISPVFSSSANSCEIGGGTDIGNTVTGTASIPVDAIVYNTTLTLSTTACFPS